MWVLRQGRRLAWRDLMRSIRESVHRLRRTALKAESSIRTSPMNPICRRLAARQLFVHAAAVFLALVALSLAAQAKDKLLDETVRLAGTILFVETKVPALVIGVVRNHETAVFGFGKVGPADDRPPDGNTLLRIGSITKAFTGALLASLVSDGVVKLTAPLQARLG